MKNNLPFSNLTIPAPCHMDWGKMTPTEKGRFCASCKYTVIDFTDGDPKKLKAAIEANGDNLCGRFRSSDLAHYPTYELIPKERMTGLRKYFVAALALLGIHSGSQVVSAQEALPPPDKHAGTFEIDATAEDTAQEYIFIGSIQETDSLPIERAFVLLEAGGITLAHGYSDTKGNFTLAIPKNKQIEDTINLYISHVGRHFIARGLARRSQNVFVELKSFAIDEDVVIKGVTSSDQKKIICGGISITTIHGRTVIPMYNTSDNPFLPRRGFNLEDEIFMNRSDVNIERY